jgi:uncharacterized protein YjiS (DUF1127 family)
MKAISITAQAKHWHNLFSRFKETLDQWDRNFTTRRQLYKLTEKELDDIGIDRVDAINEAGKPFWLK